MIRFEPLDTQTLKSFNPVPFQAWAMEDMIAMFEDGFPDHQAAMFDGNECVLIMGLIEHEDGIYWTWTIFGAGFRLMHYKHFTLFWKKYLNILFYKQISHIIDKEKPWTRHMVKMLGFEYSHDYDEQYEWWILNGS
jgi:hypothetical protein